MTKLDKGNTTTSENFDHAIMSANYDIVVIFWIFWQFAAIRMHGFQMDSV